MVGFCKLSFSYNKENFNNHFVQNKRKSRVWEIFHQFAATVLMLFY